MTKTLPKPHPRREGDTGGVTHATTYRHRLGMIALGAVRLGAIAYLSILLLMSFLETRLVYPAPSPASGDWSPPGGDYEEAWIDVPAVPGAKAARVYGWFFDKPDAKHVVLYCHGNGNDVSDLPELARLLRDRLDATVLVWDYRGYGKSEGTPNEAGVVADGLAAQRWLADRTGRKPADIAVIGRSLGGCVATAIAAEQGAAILVLQSTCTSLTDVAANRYPWLPVRWVMQNRFDSLKRIKRYEGPVLVSHGTTDEVIPFDQGRALFDAAPGRKRFVEIPAGTHNQPQPPTYYDVLVEMLADSHN
jgi:fermentation-respiration switch protein FrsA (DUF1100 family)